MSTREALFVVSEGDLHESLPPARRERSIWQWVLFATFVIVAFFGLTYSRVSLDRSGFVLDDLEDLITFEEARHKDLRVEVARLQNPARITRVALNSGFVYPTIRTVVAAQEVETKRFDLEYRWAQLEAVLAAQP